MYGQQPWAGRAEDSLHRAGRLLWSGLDLESSGTRLAGPVWAGHDAARHTGGLIRWPGSAIRAYRPLTPLPATANSLPLEKENSAAAERIAEYNRRDAIEASTSKVVALRKPGLGEMQPDDAAS